MIEKDLSSLIWCQKLLFDVLTAWCEIKWYLMEKKLRCQLLNSKM